MVCLHSLPRFSVPRKTWCLFLSRNANKIFIRETLFRLRSVQILLNDSQSVFMSESFSTIKFDFLWQKTADIVTMPHSHVIVCNKDSLSWISLLILSIWSNFLVFWSHYRCVRYKLDTFKFWLSLWCFFLGSGDYSKTPVLNKEFDLSVLYSKIQFSVFKNRYFFYLNE